MLSLRLALVLALFAAVAYAGWSQHGHGHHHSPHGGWGWKKYVGWAKVNAWNGWAGHQYSLDEHGKDYSRYAWVQQDHSKGWHGK